jgi:PAS domain S-box-containing protein
MIRLAMPPQWEAVGAGTDLLARARQLQRSWDRLLGERELGGAEVPPQATAGVRPAIVESWRRVLATGLDPTDLMPSIEADRSETQERWLEHPLGSLRHVLVEQLHRWAQESNSLVQVTDPSGLTLYLGGPDWLKERAAEMNLVEGARCSETVNGTNGVGTALAVDHPVQVFAFEHFSHHHREWVCSGAPIHDPLSGRLVGVIDLSSPWKIAHPRSLDLVTSAARTTEQCLLEGRRDQDARLRRRYGDFTKKASDLLVNREGYLLVGGGSAHSKPLDIPENGGEIALRDGSLAVAEPLGRGEAYLVRRRGSHRARRGRGPAEKPTATLSAYLDAALDCVIVADASGRIVEFNPTAERTFGYSREEALGRTMAELIVPPSLRERHTAAFARFVRTREGSMLGHRVELTGMRADGSEFPVELSLSLVEAEPVLICGALRDISARKQAESHLRELADEQAALRRVATQVAYEASSDRLVAVVAEEVARVFDVPLVRLIRYEPNGSLVIGGFSEGQYEPVSIGLRWPLDTPGLMTTIRQTGRAARVEDYAQAPGGAAAVARATGMRSAVGCPIVVEGGVWGAILLLSPRVAAFPEDAGARLADFTELVATALANAESRAALSELADEQAALRRVATLVAEGAPPTEVFDAVVAEAGQLLGAAQIGLARYENEHEISVLAIRGQSPENLGTGVRLPIDGDSVNARILRTGRSARLDFAKAGSGTIAEVLRRDNVNATVGAPIVVDGTLWGMIGASWRGDDQPPANAEKRVEKFTELAATAIANTESRAELAASEARARDLAGEQAALRRVATFVAKGTSSDELFAAVTREVAGVVDLPLVALQRYEPDRTFTVVGIAGETSFTVGSRWPVENQGLAGMILATGRPARKQDYRTMSGPLAAAVREDGMISTVGVPIVVEDSIWGFMIGAARQGSTIPAGTEEHLARFTELVATAIANSQARDRLAQLAYEQSALRRVATMVARAPASEELFSTVAREVASVLDAPGVIVTRYDADGTALTLGEAFRPELAGAEQFLGIGTRTPREPGSLAAEVFDTRGPARVDDFSSAPGMVGELARAARLGSGCAGPIMVNGAVWGKMCVFSRAGVPLPADTEDRLHDFIELVATAISNYEARGELAASEARARELADEQAALRRVATLVARDPASEAFFSAVAREVASVLNVPGALVERYEADGTSVSIGAAYDPDLSGAERLLGVGARTARDPGSLTAQVFETKHPARVDDFSTLHGPVGDAARAAGLGSGCAGPIMVNRGLWGMLAVFSRAGTALPAGTEGRLHDFIELVATAIANYEARAELAASEARARELADEQAALRRVATLVARGVSPEAIFSAVTNEMGRLFGSSQAYVGRFEADGSAIVVVGVSDGIRGVSTGSRWELEDYMASTGVYRTGRHARVERSDFEHMSGPMADLLREIGAVSSVGAPIVVEGRQWGFVTVTDTNKPLPIDAEKRLEKFAELLGTAIANADSRAELAASRARIVAAGDDARRRIERDLHDGAQQRLITLTVALRRADAKVPTGAEELRTDLTRVAEGLTTAIDELRELSRGIHPSILTEGGLSPALKALGRRSPVRVKLDLAFEQRLPDHVEVASYYTVSEALTNASKHANATRVWVSLRVEDDELLLSIGDDGVGGADPNRGSGLTGLRDRIEALGGRIRIESPAGDGTRIEVEIPIAGPSDRDRDLDELLAQATTPGPPD